MRRVPSVFAPAPREMRRDGESFCLMSTKNTGNSCKTSEVDKKSPPDRNYVCVNYCWLN